MFDRDTLRFTYVNEGAIEQLGYSREELLTMTPLHIKPEFTEAGFRALFSRIAPGESLTYTTAHRRRDGVDIQVEAVLQHPPLGREAPSGWMVSMARDLTDRLEAEHRVKAAEREVAVLEDRQRIARDLHDTVIQRLFAAGLGIEAIRGRVGDSLASERLEQVVDDLDDTVRQLRSSIFQLSLAPSARTLRTMIIDVCAEELAALGSHPDIRFEGPVDTVDDARAEHVIAVLREALSNIARHAHATRIRVSVTVDDHLSLRIEDNGSGFTGPRPGGNGLDNMAARAAELAGTFDVSPGTDGGTHLLWRVALS